MTAIDPLTSSAMTTGTTPARSPDDQFGKDTFLKLLVAQLKYQNPLAPKDGTEFLSQTAQFTMVEKLTSIENSMKATSAANEVLQAATMVGRSVTVQLPEGGTPVATSTMNVGGNLPANATVGTVHETTATVYTSEGKAVPLRLEFTKLPTTNGDNAWQVRTWSGTQLVAGPHRVAFDENGNRTTPEPKLTVAELERIAGTTGKWSPNGVEMKLGDDGDAGRLRSIAANASVALREQNGSDGKTFTGVVTGVKFTVAGPLLRIGTREIPMLDVVEVHLPPS